MESAAPESVSSAEAERGTLLHNAVEFMLTSKEWPVDIDHVNDFDYDCVVWCAGRVREFIDQNSDALIFQTHAEHKLAFPFLTEIGEGTCDYIIIADGNGWIFDFKFGHAEAIEARDSLQGMAYALAAARKWTLQQVTFTILRAQDKHESSVTYNELMLDEIYKKLRQIINKCLEPDAPLASGPHCTYCRAAGSCPELAKSMSNLPVTQPVMALAPVELGRLLDMCKPAELFIDQLKAFALHSALQGSEIPGWKVGEGKKSRKWILDPNRPPIDARLTGIANKLNVDPNYIWYTELLSPAQLEKIWGKDAKKLLSPLIETVPGKPCLKRADE